MEPGEALVITKYHNSPERENIHNLEAKENEKNYFMCNDDDDNNNNKIIITIIIIIIIKITLK